MERHMYPEYKKVKDFIDEASLLLNSSKTMEDIFQYTVKRNEKEVAVIYQNDKGKLKKYRYNKFRRHAFEIASILSEFMIQKPKNKPIVLKLNNGPHWGEIFWAILMTGYKPLLISAKTNKEGTINLINQSHAEAIITDDVYEYDILKLTLDDILKEKHHCSFAPIWEDEVIFCSSGTTGDVKLMVFNGENLVNQICCSLDMPSESKDIMYPKKLGKCNILAMVPFHHIFGFVAVFLWFTYYGKTLVFPKSMATSDVRYICQKAGVTHIFSVPLFWDSLALTLERKQALESKSKQELLDNMIGFNTGKISREEAGQGAWPIVKDKVQRVLLGNKVKYCISGGGYLTSKTLTIINGVGYNLYNGYGMTEIGVTSVELSPIVEVRLKGSIGKPLHSVTYKIQGNKTTGELLVKSPTIHIREIINGVEKETELDEDGYFHTGDIVSADASNSYYINGRIKDIIINSDGENIFPDELEGYFKGLEHVNNYCILGINLKSKEISDIVIVLEVENNINDEQLFEVKNKINEISLNLPKGARISDIYLAKKHLPIANNMKVKRFVVKKGIESQNGEYISINTKKEIKPLKGYDKQTIENILLPLREIFSKTLILPKFKIEDNAHWINELGGDSMNYVEMVQKIDEKFNIVIPEDKYGKLTCINDFVEEILTIKSFKK